MAVASIGAGIAQGISSVKNAKAEAQSVKETAEDQISERARQAKKLMSQQKTSFLKSGVYFNTGSPVEVINETYDTMTDDINAIADDANSNIKNLMRQGKTAFYSSIMQGVANAALSYFGGRALSSAGSSISSSSVGSTVSNWYNSLRGWTKGGFGQLPSSNGYSSGNITKIA